MLTHAIRSSGRSLLIAFLWLVVAGYAAFVAWAHYQGHQRAARGEAPLYTDYTPTYAASLLVREIPAEYLYMPRAMTEAGREAARRMYDGITDEQAAGVGFAPWMYPPTFILLIAPLVYLPYMLSWFVWLGVTAVPYIAAMRRILPSRLAWPFALAAPPVFFNVMYGQTGFLTAGLIALGLALLRDRPTWAGFLIGLASVKPHFGVLIPLAFVAGGHWRAFAAAAVTVIGSIAASLLAYGDEPWFAFIGTSLFHLGGFEAGAFNFRPMTTLLATLRMGGVPFDTAWAVQNMASVLLAGTVAWVWWRGRRRADTLGLQAAVLCLATPLAVPLAYLYDLVLVVPGVAWVWRDMELHTARRWEKLALFGALAAIIAVLAVAQSWAVQIGPALLIVLLGLALRRFRMALEQTPAQAEPFSEQLSNASPRP